MLGSLLAWLRRSDCRLIAHLFLRVFIFLSLIHTERGGHWYPKKGAKKPLTALRVSPTLTVFCWIRFRAPTPKIVRLKNPVTARLKTHDNNGFPLKKWYFYKSLSSRVFFGQWNITAFPEKSYHKKAPHRPTKNENQTKAFCIQKFVRLKSPVLARFSDGSGAAQFALKHSGELLSPRRNPIMRPLSHKGSAPY